MATKEKRNLNEKIPKHRIDMPFFDCPRGLDDVQRAS